MTQPNPAAAAVAARPGMPNLPLGADNGNAITNPSKQISLANQPSWDMFPLSLATADGPVPIAIPTSVSIPSPLADCGGRRDQFLKIVNERASSGARTLFNKIRQASSPQPGDLTMRQTMLVGSLPMISPLSLDRENGFIVYLGQQQNEDRAVDAGIRQEWVQKDHMTRLDAAEPTFYRPPARQSTVVARLTSPLDIRMLNGTSPAGKAITDFFVLNSSHTSLRINGVLFNPNTLVGPLPDFAVIEVGKAAVFWWHTDESLDYVPVEIHETAITNKRPLDADKEYINLTDNPPSKRQKINEGTAATGYQTEFGLPAKTPENEPTLCPDLPSKGFVVNLVSNLRTEPGHLPVAGPKISHPLVQNLQGAKGPTKGPRPPFTTPGSGLVAWRQQFQRRLRYYKEKAGNLPNGRERPHQIVVEGEFGDDDPALAIASVWEGAMRWGVKYAFGTPYLFQIARQDPLLGVTCVGAPNALIMPLIFNAAVNNPPQEEENYVKPAPPPKSREQLSQEKEDLAKMDELAEELKDKGGHNHGNKPSATTAQQEAQRQQWVGGVGHFVLAVAEREPGSEDGVRMTYMNSALIPSMGVLRATARNVVRNSSWMPEGVWPRFTSEVRQPVPQQVGGSVCGTHVVLNAWAYMLNIPINATWSTSKDEESSFYMEARTVINLALQGHMDSETILSFLTSYGYARYQSLNHIPHRARGVQSVLINIDILGDMVDGMRREERSKGKMTNKASPKGLLSGHTTGPAPGGPGGSTNPPKVLPAPPKTDPLVLPPKGPTPGAPAGSINPPKIVAPTTDPQPPNTGTAPTGTLAGCAAPVKGVVPSQGTGEKLWTQRLVEGIRSYKAERRKLGKHNFHQVRELEEQLYDDDISCAIAAVWRGLWLHNIRFAFGTTDLFRCCRKPDDGHGLLSVGAPHPLIMPLLFNIDDQNDHYRTGRSRSNDGHLMLVVAERESDSTNNIRLKIMDSLPGFVNDNVIRTTAENIVRYSGWMGLTRAGTPVAVQPTFTVERIDVPQQTDAIRCGLNVIFNAWAYMLGIPITRNRSLKSESKTTDFYMFGRHIINSALNGCLNLQTIQALFNTHEYCQPQGLEVAIPSIRSVGMNPKVLHDIVEAIMADERLQAFGSGPPA